MQQTREHSSICLNAMTSSHWSLEPPYINRVRLTPGMGSNQEMDDIQSHTETTLSVLLFFPSSAATFLQGEIKHWGSHNFSSTVCTNMSRSEVLRHLHCSSVSQLTKSPLYWRLQSVGEHLGVDSQADCTAQPQNLQLAWSLVIQKRQTKRCYTFWHSLDTAGWLVSMLDRPLHALGAASLEQRRCETPCPRLKMVNVLVWNDGSPLLKLVEVLFWN